MVRTLPDRIHSLFDTLSQAITLNKPDKITNTHGTFTIPVYDGQPPSDPATRPYLTPPKPNETVQKTFPLVDFRPEISDSRGRLGDASCPAVAARLRKHGYTAVRQPSSLRGPEDFQDGQKIRDVYLPEMSTMLKQVTGCRDVFLHVAAYRGPDPDHLFEGAVPTGLSREHADTCNGTNLQAQKPLLSRPLRLPHNDYTPLGARQSMRCWAEEVRRHGEKCGVIAREDEICAGSGFSAMQKESDALLAQHYNDHAAGRLGPRYACYSLWRPVRPVVRDPLAMISYAELQGHEAREDFVIWPYENRLRRAAGGDWRREFAMLKIRPAAVGRELPPGLTFHFLADMQTDEVLFVKLFDSAGLGAGATESMATMHGSPDLGERVAGAEERESVEIRVLAFW